MKFIKSIKVSTRKFGEFKKNPRENGYILISFVTLMPFLLALLFGYASILHISQIKTKLEAICLKKQNQVFFQQRTRLIKLLDLNPEAQSLLLQKINLQREIAAATLSGQLEVAAALSLKLNKVILNQEKLAIKQKQILFQSDEDFLRSSYGILKDAAKAQREASVKGNPIWDIEFTHNNHNIPHLSVEPTVADIAPPYKLKENFSTEQAWQFNWIMKIKSLQMLSSFLKLNYEVKLICALTLEVNGPKFQIVIPGKP